MAAAFSGGALLTTAWRSLHWAPFGQTAKPAAPPAGRLTSSPAPSDGEAPAEREAPELPPSWAPYSGARPEPRGWPADSVLAVLGLSQQPKKAIAALLEVATKLGMPVDTLAAVIAHESGWNPRALYFRDKNDDGTPRKVPFVAAGLCQLTVEAHLEGFGSWQRVREITNWPVERQLREVVLPLWTKYGARAQKAHPGLGLMLNFLPDKAGLPEDTVLGEKGAKGFVGRVYAMNTGLDTNSDGKITVGDVYQAAARVCRRAQGRRVRLDGSLWTPPGSPGSRLAFTRPLPSSPDTAAKATAPTLAKTEEQTRAPGPGASSGGRVLRLPDSSGGLLVAAIRDGREEPPTWVDVLWEGRGKTEGVRLILRVSAHCVRAPVEIEGLGTRLLRLPISYQEQIEVCRLRKWFPLTQSISEAIWRAAQRINPPLLGKWDTPEESLDSSRRMRTLEWAVLFNERLDKQIPADKWAQLWATEGKDWIVHPRIAEGKDGTGAINYGLHRLDGTPWQTPGGRHPWVYFDETQVLRAMQWEGTHPETGEKVPIIEVLRKAGMPASVLAPFEGIA